MGWRPSSWDRDHWRDPNSLATWEKSRSRSPSSDRTIVWTSDPSRAWSGRMVRGSGNWSSYCHRHHDEVRTDWDSGKWDDYLSDDKWKEEEEAWEQKKSSWDSNMSDAAETADSPWGSSKSSKWESTRVKADDTDYASDAGAGRSGASDSGWWSDYDNAKADGRDADNTESHSQYYGPDWWGPVEDSSGDVWWDGMKYHGWDYQTIIHHDLTLQYPGRKSKLTLFFIHSCAHGPEDVFHYLPYFKDFGLKPQDVRIVAPCSPLRQFPENYEGNTWFDYKTDRCWRGRADQVDYDQFIEQRVRLMELLQDEHNRLPEGGKIVLGGLSQGASIAADLLLHAPASMDKIVGLWCSRGMIQEETFFLESYDSAEWNDLVAMRAMNCPVLVYHGKDDQTVPWRVAKRSYNRLKRHPYKFNIQFEIEDDVHHATESLKEYKQVAEFLYRVISSEQDANAGRCKQDLQYGIEKHLGCRLSHVYLC